MIVVGSLARCIIFGVPARPSVPLMSGHLQCTDTFAWSRGCPFMTGTTVMVESTMCLRIKVAELNPLSDGKGITGISSAVF